MHLLGYVGIWYYVCVVNFVSSFDHAAFNEILSLEDFWGGSIHVCPIGGAISVQYENTELVAMSGKFYTTPCELQAWRVSLA